MEDEGCSESIACGEPQAAVGELHVGDAPRVEETPGLFEASGFESGLRDVRGAGQRTVGLHCPELRRFDEVDAAPSETEHPACRALLRAGVDEPAESAGGAACVVDAEERAAEADGGIRLSLIPGLPHVSGV